MPLYLVFVKFALNFKFVQVSLTLPACRQAPCCDEWTGYGVTLLPKSSTGDVHRINSYRTLPRAGDPDIAADGMSSAICDAADAAKARFYGGTSNNPVPWCSGRLGVPTSTLAGCSCRLSSTSDQAVMQQCDAGCDLWNGGDNVDEARDVVDYGICTSRPASGHSEHPSQHDVNVRFFLARPPPAVEVAGLLDGLNDNMTSSRDFLVTTDPVTGQHIGNHDNNNNGDVDDGDDDED